MSPWEGLSQGLQVVADPTVLFVMLAGVVLGSVVGVLPGIGPVGAMAVLLPLTFTLDQTAALLMLAGLFFGSMYGGSTTAILMRVPGEASSVVTAMDGFEMTKRGRAGAALAVAAIGSFIAGTLAVAGLMFAAPILSELAIKLSAPDYFAITAFALLVLSRLTGGSFAKSMTAVGLGLALATIGLDQVTGNLRFTFGISDLSQGVNLTSVAVGLFGIAEILILAGKPEKPADLPTVRFRDVYPTRRELQISLPSMFRGGILGFFYGLMPGPSGVLASYSSYALERRLSKRPDEFGSGAIQGVAGPEAANNGASGGQMVPLLILGVPFTGPAALLLTGFTIHGTVPGPLLMQQEPDLFWGLIAGMYAANAMLLVLNLPLVPMFASLLRIPRDIMLASILIIAVIGTYATRNSMFDVLVLIIIGVLGYLMAKVGLSRAALMLAFVIATLMEQSLTQSLLLASGDLSYFQRNPFGLVVLASAVVIVAVPYVLKLVGRRRPMETLATVAADDD
jgi:putative tricarboxylic transport membrane protein